MFSKDKIMDKEYIMYCVGIDIGSTAAKVIVMPEDCQDVLYHLLMPTGWSSKETAFSIKKWLNERNITFDNSHITATGYGRVSVPYANKVVTEITCHGRGAYYLNKKNCTVIDIGGQDTKIISVEKGMVTNFIMNDKCSAGTGRFLELMAEALEIPLEEIGENFDQEGPNEEITITSMCTVFAQSEVVSLVAQNKDQRDIIFALNRSVASKAISLLDRIGRESAYMMTGGVAKNAGVVLELEKRIGEKLIIPEEPQIIGAYGAALIASGK